MIKKKGAEEEGGAVEMLQLKVCINNIAPMAAKRMHVKHLAHADHTYNCWCKVAAPAVAAVQ